jgi:small subunit ribosomal protein S20
VSVGVRVLIEGCSVANIKSAEKRWRQSLKRRMRNRVVRTSARTYIKNVNRSIGAGEPDADALKLAVRALDKAAEKGIIHPNQAARRKSRLMRRFAVVASGGTVQNIPGIGTRRAGR